MFILISYSYSWAQHRKLLSGAQASAIIPASGQIVLDDQVNISFVEFKKGINPDTPPEQLLVLQDEHGLELVGITKDKLGLIHKRFQQTYKGVPVLGAEFILHADQDEMKTGTGRLIADLNIDVVPKLSEADALQFALQDIAAEEYMWEDNRNESFIKAEQSNPDASFRPQGRLLISPQGSSGVLVYQFEIYAKKPLGKYIIAIGAVDGQVIFKYNKLHIANAVGTGETLYDGEVHLDINYTNNQYLLHDGTRGNGIRTYDALEYNDFSHAELVSEGDNHFNEARSQAGVSAHFGLAACYDYFRDHLGRNSFDDAGAVINSYVHFGSDFSNAFWDGARLAFGDGDGVTSTPFVSLDLVGHELAHAVTQYSADLIYAYESGALNESFSDIFGQCVEMMTFPETASWNLADQIFTDGVSMIRSMSNPNSKQQPDSYLGDYWYSGDMDNGGVHINSGVQNFWFYLLVEGGSGTNDFGYAYNVPSIGLEKAQQIAYRNLTVYLSSSSTYVDARIGAEQATIDLYGQNSGEHLAVIEAWQAVAVPTFEPSILVQQELEFGRMLTGVTKTKNLTIYNSGLSSLDITGIELQPEDLFDMEQGPYVVPAQDSLNLAVSFQPDVMGDYTAEAVIYSSADTVSVTFLANVVDIPTYQVQPLELSLELFPGDTVTNRIDITNGSEYPLNFDLSAYYLNEIFQYRKTGLTHSVGKASFFSYEKVSELQAKDTLSGYYWKDSESGAVYDWMDIQSTGVRVQLSDDSNSDLIDMGIEFPFFDEVFTRVSISSNGWISFTNQSGSIWSTPLPDSWAPENVIALMASDLYPGNGACHYYYDQSRRRFIVQYTDWTFCCSSSADFTMQIQLFENGKILLLYDELNISGNGTVGIQNASRDKGLTVSYNDQNIFQEGKAIEIGPLANSWISTDVKAISIPAGSTGSFNVRTSAVDMGEGQYNVAVPLLLEDFSMSMDSIKVNLLVTGAPNLKASSTVHFDSVFISHTQYYDLVIKNGGTEDLEIASVSFSGQSDIFGVEDFDTSIPPKGEGHAKLYFTPGEKLEYNADLTVASSDPDNPEHRISVSGVGVEPPAIKVSPESLTEVLFTGEIMEKELTIDNTDGGSKLIFEIHKKPSRSAEIQASAIYSPGFYSTRTSGSTLSGTLGNGANGGYNSELVLDSTRFLDTLNRFPSETTGACLVNGLWYVVRSNGQLLKYNPESESVTGTYAIHSNAYGMAFDGSYLWIGDYWGTIRGYNLEGNLVGSFDVPFYGYTSITFNGLHFLVSEAFHEDAIYEVDYAGSVIETVGNPGVEIFQIAFDEGQLWLMDGSYMQNTIYLGGFSDHSIELLDTLYIPVESESFTLAVSENELLWADRQGLAYLLSKESSAWLSTDVTKSEVEAGEVLNVAVLLDATGLKGGIYTHDLMIVSNDPQNPEVRIPVTLEVTDAANVSVEADSIDFHQVFTGYSADAQLEIRNIGTETLQLSTALDESGFFVADTSLEIDVRNKASVNIRFSPADATSHTASLILHTNDPLSPQVEILLKGNGLDPPVISIAPDSFSENLFTGETSEQIVTIDNSQGGSSLFFEIAKKNASSERSASIHSSIGFYSSRTSDQVQDFLPLSVDRNYGVDIEVMDSLSHLDTLGNLPSGITGACMVGDYLFMTSYSARNLYRFNTEENAVVELADFSYEPYGMAYDGIYLWIGSNSGVIRGYDTDGNLIGSFDSPVSGFSSLAFDGEYFIISSAFTDGEYYRTDHTGQVIEVLGRTGIDGYQMAFDGYFLWVTKWSNGNVLYKLEFQDQELVVLDTFNTQSYIDAYALAVMDEGLLLIEWDGVGYLLETGGGFEWLKTDISSGEIPAGEFRDIPLTFDAEGLYGGVYMQDLVISSNDPAQQEIIVPTVLNVTGVGNISVSMDSVDFGEVFTGVTDSVFLQVKNTGTDVLEVTTILGDNLFAVDEVSLELAIKQTASIPIIFAPLEEGRYTAVLILQSNDPDHPSLEVTLSGNGVDPPVISVSPSAMTEHLNTGESSEQTLTIDNSAGLSDLDFSISIRPVSSSVTAVSNLAIPKGEREKQPYAKMPAPAPSASFGQNSGVNGGRLFGADAYTGNIVEFNTVSGEVLNEIPAPEDFSGPDGLAFDGTYLYFINSYASAQVFKLNPDNGEVLDVFSFAGSEAIDGLAVDDQYLYASDYLNGRIIIVDLVTRQAIESVDIGLYVGGGITYGGMRGTYFVSDFRYVYELDALDHEIINVSPQFNAVYGLAYSAEAGVLFVSDAASEIVAMDPDGWSELYSFSGSFSALASDESSFSNNWLNIDLYSGKIPAGEQTDLTVTFDAAGMFGGTYERELVVSHNDPHNPSVSVLVSLDVTGAPDIEITASEIFFDTIYAGGTDTTVFVVRNAGSDTLEVSFTVDNDVFSVDKSTLVIAPRITEEVNVLFSSDEIGTYTGTMHLETNDPNDDLAEIPLNAVSVNPPAISLSASEILAVLDEGETLESSFDIENAADAHDLYYTVKVENRQANKESGARKDVPGFYSKRYDQNFTTPKLPHHQRSYGGPHVDFDSLVFLDTLNNFPRSNTGMVYVEGYLYIVVFEQSQMIKYDVENEEVVDWWPVASYPYSITYDGQYLWVGNYYGVVTAYNMSGEEVGNFDSPVPLYEFPTVTWDGDGFLIAHAFNYGEDIFRVTASGELQETYELRSDRMISQLVYHEGSYWVLDNQAYPNWLFRTELVGGELVYQDSLELYVDYSAYSIAFYDQLIFFADWSSGYILENPIGYLWLKLQNPGGIISGGSLESIDFTLDASGLADGLYSADICVYSNDPDHPKMIVACTLSIGNYPPQITTAFEDQTLFVSDDSYIHLDAEIYFTDPENDEMFFEADFNEEVLDITSDASEFIITAIKEGTDTVTIKASDGRISSTGTFIVWVREALASEVMRTVVPYPNPGNGIFRIDADEKTTFKIFDMTGREMKFETEKKGKATEIRISSVSSGIYYLKGNLNGKTIYSGKIVVE